jgi:ADP-dependent NAD(P)H-hydrate dehydratase / NAD(P)H-hydrate epimerase
MKIFSVERIREADSFTINNEPIKSIDLMERASAKLFDWIIENVSNDKKIKIIVGLGNNGGDGLALGRMLASNGFHVHIGIIHYSKNSTEDFNTNLNRIKNLSNISVVDIYKSNEIPDIAKEDVVVDAILGSGLTRPVSGIIGEIIGRMNSSGAVIISVDIPTGLFADISSVSNKGEIINADYTLSFQYPKLAFMLPENEHFIGRWHILDIGLSQEYTEATQTKNNLVLMHDIKPLIKGRAKFSHKGSYGHALLIAGSYGKMGAAILASRACLRSGIGLLHTHVPKSGISVLHTALPETMLSIDRYDNYFSEVPDLNAYSAIGIGPGLGKEQQSQMAMKLLIQNSNCPLVIDADAINILAEHPTWLSFLPSGSILTPHPGEFKRIAGGWSDDFERLKLQRLLSQKHGLYIVLKGAHTSISLPDGQCFFNSTGNPGMATAGSGDVLTGIITGLLASGYTSAVSAIMGSYIHGLSGDIAAASLGMESIIASDIIDNIGQAFKTIRELNK